MVVSASNKNSQALSRNDVTFRGQAADGCYGVVAGNDSVGGTASGWSVNTLGLFGGGWNAFVKDDNGVGTLPGYLGLDWTLAASNGTSSGAWTLTISDPPPSSLPVTVDLLAVLKGGPSFAAYFFDDETFSMTGSSQGTFSIKFKNNGGNFPNLSHMTLYLRPGSPPTICAPGTPGCGGTPVPEPGTLAMLGMGIAALALSRRRFGRRD